MDDMNLQQVTTSAAAEFGAPQNSETKSDQHYRLCYRYASVDVAANNCNQQTGKTTMKQYRSPLGLPALHGGARAALASPLFLLGENLLLTQRPWPRPSAGLAPDRALAAQTTAAHYFSPCAKSADASSSSRCATANFHANFLVCYLDTGLQAWILVCGRGT